MAEPTPVPIAASTTAPSSARQRVALAAVQRLLTRQQGMPNAWLSQEVAQRMAQRLPLVRLQPTRLMDWWGGSPASERLLARQYPRAQRLVVQPCVAGRPMARAGAVSWWHQLRHWQLMRNRQRVAEDDVAQLPPGQLVWANMMLHWSGDVPALLARWHAALQVDGFLMFSCFGPDTLHQLRRLYAHCGWGPPASDFADMHDIGDALVRAGFAAPVMDMEMLHLHWPSPERLLAELRTLGGNTAPSRFAGLRTPRWRAQLEAALAALAGPDGRIRLGFEIIYGHAFRPAPRAVAGAPTTVSLDAMRDLVRRRRGAEPTPGDRGGGLQRGALQVLG